MKKIIVSAVLIAGILVGTTSCEKAKEKTKNAVEATKDAAKKTGDAVKNAADKTVDAVKDGANAVKEGAEKVADAVKGENAEQIAKGKALFTAKTCATCHGVDKKVIGPSIKDIAKTYADKKGNMVQFLKGKSAAIVDTDPAQVAVMKANLDGFVKDLKAEELQALTAYIRSVK